MAVSDKNITTFSNDPRKGREVVDAYDSEQMQSFLSDPASDISPNLLAESFPDLKADQIQSILTDPNVLSFTAENEIGVDQLVKAVSNALPTNVTLKAIAGEISLPDILSFSDSLRESLGSKQWASLDNDFFLSLYATYEDYGQVFSEGGSWPELTKKIALAKINGIATSYGVDLDSVVTAAYRLGIVKELMQSGMVKDAIKWIDESNLPDELKELIYRDMVGIAAEAGLASEINDLIEKAKGQWKPHIYVPTIEKILNGFRIPQGAAVSRYPQLASDLIEQCNAIMADWYLYDRNGEVVGSSRMFNSASEQALVVLQYDERTRAIATAYRTFRPIKTSWKTIARQRFPFLVI